MTIILVATLLFFGGVVVGFAVGVWEIIQRDWDRKHNGT